VEVNPISWPTEALRNAVLHGLWPDVWSVATYSLVAATILMCGALAFRALRPGFADVL